MSIRVMTLVWQHFPRGGSEKLALLAMADWCDDNGGTLFPSMGAIARKINASKSQTRRIIHSLTDKGLLEVIGNHQGGKKGQTRRYRLNLAALQNAEVEPAAPCTENTPGARANDGSHPCAQPLAPVPAKPSLTVKETSVLDPAISALSSSSGPGRKQETLLDFLARIKVSNELFLPEDDPIFQSRQTMGLNEDMLSICWFFFKRYYGEKATRKKDWRAQFRNAVRGNWFKLWYINSEGGFQLTTPGWQAKRELLAAETER